MKPRTKKILRNLTKKSILEGAHIRARMRDEVLFMVLTICKNFNPLTLLVRAAGGHKKSYKAHFLRNLQLWQDVPGLAIFGLSSILF